MATFLNTEEVAAALKVSAQTVRNYIKRGLLKTKRIKGVRGLLISQDELAAFLANRDDDPPVETTTHE